MVSFLINCSKASFSRSSPTPATDMEQKQAEDLLGEQAGESQGEQVADPNDGSSSTTDNRSPFPEDLISDDCNTTKTIDYDPKSGKAPGAAITVNGSFCPNISHSLSILFIIDNSASMGKHFNNKTFKDEDGNDPQINNSCGRLRAAKAIIKKFQSERYEKVDVEISVISFASTTIEAKTLKKVSTSIFCETIIQGPKYNQPGGITKLGIIGSTNYEDPFKRARQLLDQKEGKKIVYFITDGNPNTPGPESNGIKKGIEAAQKLRKEVDNTTINALFLKASNPEEAKGILEEMTGKKDRVLLATDANELEKRIIEFPVLDLQPSTLKGTLTISPSSPKPIEITMSEDQNVKGKWDWTTEPFIPQGREGETVKNIVKVNVKDNLDNIHEATVTVSFAQ